VNGNYGGSTVAVTKASAHPAEAAHKGEMALDPKTATRVIARLNDLQKKTEADAFRELSPR